MCIRKEIRKRKTVVWNAVSKMWFKNQRKCNTSKQNFNVFDIQSVNCFDREIESLISSLLLRTCFQILKIQSYLWNKVHIQSQTIEYPHIFAICTFKHNVKFLVHYQNYFKIYPSLKFWLKNTLSLWSRGQDS